MATQIYQDIIAAVAAFLNDAMAGPLDVTDASPEKAFTDYAHQVALPYAIVHDGPESYAYQSDDSFIADGALQVSLHAASKSAARRLGRECIRVMSDPNATLPHFLDGTCLEMRPGGSQSVPHTETGPDQPAEFIRVVMWHYRAQYD
jgi:hypothetical protein